MPEYKPLPFVLVERPLSKTHNQKRHRLALIKWLATVILCNYALIGVLLIIVRLFEKAESLSTGERKAFNVLLVFICSFISICMGWFVNEVGAMIRWSILSRGEYTLEDVEEILSLNSMAATWATVSRHVLRLKVSPTTAVSATFLITAILARLSVGIFGLAFNVDSQAITLPAVETTLWPGLTVPGSTGGLADKNNDMYLTLTKAGLNAWANPTTPNYLKVGPNKRRMGPARISKNNNTLSPVEDLTVQNLNVSVDGGTVAYHYALRDFLVGTNTVASNRTVTASSICRKLDQINYEQRPEETPIEQFFDPDRGNVSYPIDNQDKMGIFVIQESTRNTKYDPIHNPCGSRCTTLWILIRANFTDPTMLKCNSTLSDVNFPAGEDEVNPDTFPDLNIANSRAESYSSLIVAGGYEVYYGNNTKTYFWSRVATKLPQEVPLYPFFALADVVEIFDKPHIERWAAGLLARNLGVLVQFIDNYGGLERVQIQAAVSSTRSLLVVHWNKMATFTCILLVLQILGAVLAMRSCWDVIVKDSSNLSMAQVLKAITEELQGGGLADGKELARSFGELNIVYGTEFDARDKLQILGLRKRGDALPRFPDGQYE